jgi:hypothetical protein
MTTTVFESDRVFMDSNAANIQNASDSASVTFSKIYDNPVVVAHTATNSGGQPVDDRVANLTGSGCDIFAHEPDQQGHNNNTHTYFVAESGVHETPEGHPIEVGRHQTKTAHWDDSWNGNKVNFETDWDSAPVVLATVNTHNNGLFATPAVSNVTADGFEISLLSEDNENTHVETIGWIAFPDVGAIQMDGVPVESSVISATSTNFSQSFSTKPDYVADNMGNDGSGAWVRGSNWTSTDISWYDESGGLPTPYGYVAVPENSVIRGYDGDSFYSGTLNYKNKSSHNYFGEVGVFRDDVSLQGKIDGFKRTVGYADATSNSNFEDIFTGQFRTNDFADSGPGKDLYLAFAAKWNEIPVWGHGGSWVRKPAPDPNNYQLYVLKNDGQNSRDEYFRLYYSNSDDTSTAYIADPFVWKGWKAEAPTDAEIFGSSTRRTIWPSDGSVSAYGYDGLDSNGNPKNTGGHYAGTIDQRGTVHTPPTASTASLNTQTTGAFTSTSSVATAESAGTSPSPIRSDVTVDSATVVALTSDFSTSVMTASSSLTPTTGITTGIKISKETTEVTATGLVTNTSTETKDVDASLTYDGPGSVTATVNSNKSITVSWSKTNSEANQFHVQMSRNGAPWTDPVTGATTDASNTSLIVGDNSDKPYDEVVGVDSSFKFRVRAEGSGTSSDWEESRKFYTEPVPPHNPSIGRPDENTFKVSWELQSNTAELTKVRVREDTGSGYGSWINFQNFAPDSSPITISVGDESHWENFQIKEDARYQIKLAHQNPDASGGVGYQSEYVYADYGNQNNVYFEDDFESGDISAWDSSYGGHSVGGGNHGDTGISDADEGSNYLKGWGADGDTSTWIQKDLGDLSSETNVLVRCAFSVGSLDGGNEAFGIDWYDGSSWRELKYLYSEFNEGGWIEFHTIVPDSWLSSDSRIRVGTTPAEGYYAGGDFFAVDRIVVSDLLHEYTKPAPPSNVQVVSKSLPYEVEGTVQPTITIDWTQNATFSNTWEADKEWKKSSDSGWNTEWGGGKPYEIPRSENPALEEDTLYDIRVKEVSRQYRHGNSDYIYQSDASPILSEVRTLADETATVTPTTISSSFDPTNPSTILTTSGVVGSSTSTFESGGDSSAVGSGKCGASVETKTGVVATTVDSHASSANANAEGVTASANTGTQTGRSVQATSATEIGSTGDSVTAAEGSVPETGATPTGGDGSVQTIADGGLVVSSSDTKPSGAATSAESSTGLPRASTTTSVGVGSTTTESPADVAGAQADGVSSEETTTFSVAETETVTTDTIQSRGEVISNASVTASDAVPKTGTAATTATADGSDKTVGTNSFGVASTVAAVTAESFDGMLATPKAAKPEASTTALGETVKTTTSTRGIGLSGIGVEPLQQNFTTDTRLGFGSPEGFSGGRTDAEVLTREGRGVSSSTGGNVTSSDVSPALPAVYTQSQSFAVSALMETNGTEASTVTESEGGSVVDIVTLILTNGTALSTSRSKTHSSTDVRTARMKLVARLTPTLVESETFESPAFTQSDDSGISEVSGLSSTSEAATSTVADASVASIEVSPQQPSVEAQTVGVGNRPEFQPDTLESATLSESLSESTTATVALQEIGDVYTTTTVKAESNAQVQALPGFGATTATAIINAIDGMVTSPVVSGAFTTTTSDALSSGFDALGKNRLDPKTASVAVVPTTIVEATTPRTPVDVRTKTNADGRETVVFGVGTIAEPYTETTSLAIQQQVTVDDVDSAFGLTTLLTKGDEFDAENTIIETEADQSTTDTDARTSYDTEAEQDDYETDGEY